MDVVAERKCKNARCGKLFTPQPGHGMQVYCTHACQAKLNSQKQALKKYRKGNLPPWWFS